jgi:hypothetical protein
MPVYPLLQGQAFEPELIDAMARAFEDALRVLQLTNRNDPLNTIVAKRIIEVAQTGERDPQRIREQVLHSLHDNSGARSEESLPSAIDHAGRMFPTCELSNEELRNTGVPAVDAGSPPRTCANQQFPGLSRFQRTGTG